MTKTDLTGGVARKPGSLEKTEKVVVNDQRGRESIMPVMTRGVIPTRSVRGTTIGGSEGIGTNTAAKRNTVYRVGRNARNAHTDGIGHTPDQDQDHVQDRGLLAKEETRDHNIEAGHVLREDEQKDRENDQAIRYRSLIGEALHTDRVLLRQLPLHLKQSSVPFRLLNNRLSVLVAAALTKHTLWEWTPDFPPLTTHPLTFSLPPMPRGILVIP